MFTEAERSNAILFFDEADAIFGKRSEVKDAHDRYANIEVGYLLQRIESYDGVTILATNLRTNIDEAFTRRLQFIINFPFPDEAQRLAIWQVLRPTGLPVDAAIDWNFMAHRYAIAGGNIRNILVAAAFMAAQDGQVLKMEHLLKATKREMQKMGRFIKE
ncbi:MAG TPA: ATP-binding protein, partial [Anaerolineaceae bacterium]|nr:ATP-binding protein [Anaerolineaceae bacterium]